MIGHLGKLALVVGLSHGYRLAGRTLGPRWAGLIAALPCSTAITLVGGGTDHGTDHALQMAEACWAGLAAASVLPLIFAAVVIAERSRRWAIVAAVLSYPLVLAGLGLLAQLWGDPIVPSLTVLAASTLVARRLADPDTARRHDRPTLTPTRILALRTLVPLGCFSVVLALGEQTGPALAGVLGTFPSVTLTALVLCHLEAGPVAAVRMARALPPGQWAMVAFLAVFAATVASLGLLAGAVLGYLAAVVSLLGVARLANPPVAVTWTAQLRHRRRQPARPATEPLALRWPRPAQRFSPRFEVGLA